MREGYARFAVVCCMLGGFLLLSSMLVPVARAFDARSGEVITIGADRIVDDDLYLAGQSITIDGTVRGDVVAFGQTITINGAIDGSLTAAAQTVIVNAPVRDSVRVAAQALLLEGGARVGRDLMFAGYSLENRGGSSVGRDAAIAGYQALLGGTIGRNVQGGLGALEIRGTVGGNVDVAVGDADGPTSGMGFPPPAVAIPFVRPGIALAESSRVDGRLIYLADREFAIAPRQVAGGVSWNARPVEQPSQPEGQTVLLEAIRRLAALAVIGLLLVWLAPGWTRRLADTMQARPLPSLGWGVVGWLVAGAVGIGLAVGTALLALGFGVATLSSLVGMVVALGLLGEGVLIVGQITFAGLVAPALAGYLAGSWVLQWARPAWVAHRVWPLLVGLPIFVILSAIPFVGGLIGFLASLAALGALWIALRDRMDAAPRPRAMLVPR